MVLAERRMDFENARKIAIWDGRAFPFPDIGAIRDELAGVLRERTPEHPMNSAVQGQRAELGGFLRGFRERRGMSRNALAEVVGVSWNTVKDIEEGIKLPREKTFERMVAALELGEDERNALTVMRFMPRYAKEEATAGAHVETEEMAKPLEIDAVGLGEPNRPYSGLGALLKGYRDKARMGQTGLATRAGIERSLVSMIERGVRRASGKNLDALITALGLTDVEGESLRRISARLYAEFVTARGGRIDPRTELGKKLRSLREEEGMIVRDLAGKVGVRPATIYRYELGTCLPSRQTLREILDALRVDGAGREELLDWPGLWEERPVEKRMDIHAKFNLPTGQLVAVAADLTRTEKLLLIDDPEGMTREFKALRRNLDMVFAELDRRNPEGD